LLRLLGFLIVLPLLLLLVAGAHAYLLQRLVLDFAPPAAVATLATGVVAVFALLTVASPIGERMLPPRRHRFIAWPASLWMGFGFFSTLPLLLLEAVFFALGIDAEPGSAPLRWRAGGVLCNALLLCAIALRSGLRPPMLREVAFEIERWPRVLDGYRIVQITDIHIGPLLDRRFAAELVERVNALNPDLVAVTGDLVDGPVRHLAPEVAPFAKLRGRDGVYFVTGNHDHLSHAPSWVPHIESLGMRVLRNERIEIGKGRASFDLVGVDDYRAHLLGGGAQDLDAALAGRDPERAAVLLAHDPTTFKHARRRPIDLQISGHTHGGQIWPFNAFVRLAVPWVSGIHRDGRAQLYVSRGTGFWGPPMRLFAPAEITQIELRTKGERDS
jgi:predicted MPP superfamily phosphohydrolase